VLDDPAASEAGAAESGVTIERERVKRILLCSGKIHYALREGRKEREADRVAIVRLEQLYPFPRNGVAAVFDSYPNAKQVIWVQEEPRNMGAWMFVDDHLQGLLGERTLTYVGRSPAASPATGSFKDHVAEEAEIVQRALAKA